MLNNTRRVRCAVVKLTGRVFKPEYVEVLKEISSVLTEAYDNGVKLAVIVGGGEVARTYIDMAKALNVSLGWQDVLGVQASRLNAALLASVLGQRAYFPIPDNIEEFIRAWNLGKLVVGGGLQPGQSTNAVAAALAELLNANLLINATHVDGVYDKDPRYHPNAKLLKEVSIEQLKNILTQQYLPGKYELLDPIALSIIERAKINVVFVNAFKPQTIKAVINGDETFGTWLKHT